MSNQPSRLFEERLQGHLEPTKNGFVYVKPQYMECRPSQFEGIQIKVLYENKAAGELTCLLKWAPGTTLPFHKHPEIEQSWVLEGSFSDHDGICRAGEYVYRTPGSMHETHSAEGCVILAVYRKPNIFRTVPDSMPSASRSRHSARRARSQRPISSRIDKSKKEATNGCETHAANPRQAGVHALGGRGERHRHDDRVVRLSHLRDRSLAGAEQAVFPDARSTRREVAGHRHHRRWLLRAASRRHHSQSLRRSARPQVDAHPDARQHGRRHDADRPAADLREYRHCRADPAGRIPAGPGDCRRR